MENNRLKLHFLCFFYNADLDFASLARGYCLLQMPKMPETRGKSFPDFEPTDIEINKIPFK